MRTPDTAPTHFVPAWVARVGLTAWAFIGVAVAVGVVLYVVGALRAIVLPLAISGFFAVVFLPLVDGLQARRVPRAVGAAVAILSIFGVVAVAIGLVVFGVIDQREALTDAFDDAQVQFEELDDRYDLAERFEDLRSQAGSTSSSSSGGLGGGVGTALGSVFAVASGAVLGTVLLYYLLKDGRSLAHAWVQRRAPERAAQAERILRSAAASVRGYFRGRTILAAAQGIATGVILAVMGVPLAASIGVVNFIGAYIPYFGAFIGGVFAVLMGFAEGGPALAIAALVVVLVVQVGLENLLEPRVMSNSLSMHPIAVLLSTVAGGLLVGVAGLILAVPTVAIALFLFEELRESGFFAADEAPEN